MTMEITTREVAQQLMLDGVDEINVDLSEFVPLVNKIADAAANFVTKADKRLNDEKNPLYGNGNRHRLRTGIIAAKQIVRISDGMNRQLRVNEVNADDMEAANE